MSAHQFARDQLAHFNALCSSSQTVAFTEAMNLDSPAIRLVRAFGDYAIAHREEWTREELEAGK